MRFEQTLARLGPHTGHVDPLMRTLLRVLKGLGHTMCGLRGHSAMLHFEPDRLYLRCVRCGYETPGWEIGVS